MKLSSYQKLKLKNFELQEQVDMFKKTLTYCHTEPRIKVIGEEYFTEYNYMIQDQKFIEDQLKYRLTLWIANNLEALEKINHDRFIEEFYNQEYKQIENSLKALEILKNHFYEEYKLPNGKVSLLFRLNDNKDLELVKKELEK